MNKYAVLSPKPLLYHNLFCYACKVFEIYLKFSKSYCSQKAGLLQNIKY